MNLRDLMVDSKVVEVPFDGYEKFRVKLGHISRTEMSKMVESSQTSKMSRSTRQIEKELDTDKFLNKFVDRAIKGWSGLTVEIASNFLPLEVTEENKDKEIDYNKETALLLLKESDLFDNWVNAKITDIDTFR